MPDTKPDTSTSTTSELERLRAELAKETALRERLEKEISLSQRLDAVGQLAAGVAHEINTPVQYVGDSVHFLRNAFDDLTGLVAKYKAICRAYSTDESLLAELGAAEEASDLEYLEEQIPKAFDRIFDGTERVATIVRAMKEFAHVDSREMRAADLNKALGNTLTMARNEYKYIADVETKLGDIPPVVCHIGDLNQVFLNLVVNAAHAIGDVYEKTQNKGKITIATTREGDHVVVAITDTGCGIPEAIRARIFEPFFTTKPAGKGTGQGLAISRSIIVERHSGAFTFESTVGEGTTFFIRLPIEGADKQTKRDEMK